MIKRGDLLTIKPQWLGPGETGKFTYVARRDEVAGKVDISALELLDWAIWPWERVGVEMVEPTGARWEP